MKQRLARIEAALQEQDEAPCSLCHGDPGAMVYDILGHDFGPTGERYLFDEHCSARITDDLCCRRCGCPARGNRLIVLKMLTGSMWPPKDHKPGRRLPPTGSREPPSIDATTATPRC